MEQGWVKLHRSISQHWIFEDAEMLRVWIAILLLASHKHSKLLFNGTLVEVPRGSFVVSKLQWSKHLKLSRQRLDRVLKILVRDQMIVQQANKHRTFIRVVNYDTYQAGEEVDGATHLTTADATDSATPSTTALQQADIADATPGIKRAQSRMIRILRMKRMLKK